MVRIYSYVKRTLGGTVESLLAVRSSTESTPKKKGLSDLSYRHQHHRLEQPENNSTHHHHTTSWMISAYQLPERWI